MIKNIIRNILIKEAKIKVSSSEYEKLFEDDMLVVVKPLTHQASCKYGTGTKWCIASSKSSYWDRYTEKTNTYAGKNWVDDTKKPVNIIPNSIMYFVIQKNEAQTNPFSKVALQYNPDESETSGGDIFNNIRVWDATDKNVSIHKLYDNIPNFNEAFYYIEEDYLKEKDNIYDRTGIWV
jgi:hypothetical protein